MSFYIVHYENKRYANDELFYTAIAGGERAFMRMLSRKEVVGKDILDQIFYPVTDDQYAQCLEYDPVEQDFDQDYRNINALTIAQISHIQDKTDTAYPGATLIRLVPALVPPLYRYRHVEFFKIQDFKQSNKYKMVPKLASVFICGRRYVALNAVNITTEAPIIVTIGN